MLNAITLIPKASAIDLQGPFLAGLGGSLLGFGILVVQAETFAAQRAGESKLLFAFVAVLVTLNLAEAAAGTAMVFNCLFSPLHRIPLSCSIISNKEYTFILACSLVIATMSQCFFSLKAYRITTSALALAIMAVLIVCAAASQLAVVIIPYANPGATFSSYLLAVKIAKGTAALTDVMISAIFLVELRKYRNKSAMFASTDSLLVRLRSLSLQTASVTSLGAIATIAVTVVPGPVALWGVAPNLILSKLYSISTLHVLNHRRVLQAMMKSRPTPILDSSERRGPSTSSTAGKRSFLSVMHLGRGSSSNEATQPRHAGIEVHLQDFTNDQQSNGHPAKPALPAPTPREFDGGRD